MNANNNRRWGFYIAAIIMFVTALASLLLAETRPSAILAKEVEEIKSSTGCVELYSNTRVNTPTLRSFLRQTLFRPLYFYFTEPIVATVVTLGAIAWSLAFIFTESLTVVFSLEGFTEVQTSLFFIPLLVGIMLSAPVRIRDLRLLRRKSRLDQAIKPEDKLFGFALGAPALAFGLWMFAWTTPQAVHTHWIVPCIALAIIGFAINEFEYVLGGYLTDTYATYAASAVGSMSTIRGGLAGSFPLFAYYMYTGISTNAASSILAGVATVFCVVPFVLIRYGGAIRARSPYAQSDVRD